jgi:general stress protein 26
VPRRLPKLQQRRYGFSAGFGATLTPNIMSNKSLSQIAEQMAGIDIAILSTHTEGGEIANRPLSNNGDVTYDGTSYYFTYEQARAVSDIQRDPKVALGFSSEAGIFSDGIYVAVEGMAELIREKSAFQQHWTSDLNKWFENGVDTPGIVLIKVKAKRVTYWKGREEGEVEL